MNNDFTKELMDTENASANTGHFSDCLVSKQSNLKEFLSSYSYKVSPKDEAILRTATESKAQTELLDNQLREVKKQNELLIENCSTLKELNSRMKEELENSLKEAKKSRRREKIAISVAIVSPVVSVIASVLIALYL